MMRYRGKSAPMELRHNWTQEEVLSLMTSPLEGLLDHARAVHQEAADTDVQQCQLLSIKTGGCPENCGYCSQSAHYKTQVDAEGLMDVEPVLETARRAKEAGATRFCMGGAWRSVPKGKQFDRLLEMISGVAELDIEVCCTFGMAQADQLKDMEKAGLTAYNHNLDSGRSYYDKVVSTRQYEDRLNTIKAAREAGVQVCCGGILGMGETMAHRAELLAELAQMDPHPESVPVNLLVPVDGTPMEGESPVPFEEFLRMVATARILMPRSRVRLSAGRNMLSEEEQLKCFEVGANSIFVGEKLLTAPNVDRAADAAMTERLGSPA